MKKQFLFLFLFATVLAFAQAPQFLNYQAVARNGTGVIANGSVKLRFTIHDGSTGGNIIYQETHAGLPTNAYGLLTTEIGSGAPNSGTFSAISWGTGAKYLQVEMDPTNGSNYTDLGTTQLLSVPYALQANRADTAAYALAAPQTTYTAGTGISITNNTIANTAPNTNQTIAYDSTNHVLSLSSGGGSISLLSLIPAGTILPFAGPNVPAGFLACHGQVVNIADYPALFNAIGTAWGNGGGVLGKFSIPELRGLFLRGLDDGANPENDPDRASRVHYAAGGNTGATVGSFQPDAHQNITGNINGVQLFNQFVNTAATGVFSAVANGSNANLSNGGQSTVNFTMDASLTNRTSTETRPKNAYVNYIIKY